MDCPARGPSLQLTLRLPQRDRESYMQSLGLIFSKIILQKYARNVPTTIIKASVVS
jgi:hypothetical protein